MMKRYRLLAQLLAILAVFSFVAAACGDDDVASDTTSTSGDDTTTDTGDTGDTTDTTDTGDTGGAEECSGASADQGVTDDSISVGIAVSITGDNASGQQGFEQGLEAYLEDLNARGGVCGRTIEYTVEDEQSDTNVQNQMIQDMNESDKVFAILASWPNFSSAEYADSNGIPMIGTAYTAGWQFSDNFFGVTAGSWKAKDINNLPTAPSATESVYAYIAAKTGAKNFASFGYSQSASASSAQIACDNFTKYAAADQECKFVDATAEFGFSSIGAVAAQALSNDVKMFYAGMDIAGCVTVTNDLRKAGLQDFTFQCAVGIDDANVEAFGHDLDNIVILRVGPDFKSDDPEMVKFIDTLAEYQPGVDPGITVLNGWWAGIFFEDVLTEMGKQGLDFTRENFITTARTADKFKAWTANGLLGSTVDWTENRHEAIEAGTYAPDATACVGTLFRADVDAGTFVPVGPDPLCLQTMTSAEDVAAYAAGGDGGASLDLG